MISEAVPLISVRPEPLMVPDPLNDSIAAILAAGVTANCRFELTGSCLNHDGLNDFRGSTNDFSQARAVDGSDPLNDSIADIGC